MKKSVIPERGYRNLRKGRRTLPNYYYFITICCKEKKKILDNKSAFEIILKSCFWLEKEGYIIADFIIVMPNHMHWIFQLLDKKPLSRVIKSFKEYTGREIKKHLSLSETVWQRGFYDHAIRKDESLIEIIKYSLYNPVRAGIVESPDDYPYWWCRYDLKGEDINVGGVSNADINGRGFSSTDGLSRLETAPTGGESRLETAPTGGESRLETAPTDGESRLETAPTGGESRLETAPTGGESRLETAPTDGSRLETAPTGGAG